jgi:Asp-tRNA(Asn)/Glu-tRNA(Gln) amidotransferase A subunit family amidase
MQAYKTLHRFFPPNDLPNPFAFNPAPLGTIVPANQHKPFWKTPPKIPMPDNMDDLAFYSIGQLSSLIFHKKISSVDLTRFYISRLKKWGDTLQCVISLTEDSAIVHAMQADKELRAGRYRGPLHGIPYGLKDLFAVKGTRTTWGTTPYKNQVLHTDAFTYTKLREAGAILCAKLSMGALAYDNKWFGGETKNPWNLKQGSSGSSAGSASATAAGLLPFAIGTETWGSIISPSTRCGVTGLRPTFGSVSRSGAMVLSWSLDKIGPICRNAEDAAFVFAAINGTDGLDRSAVKHAFNYHGRIDWKKIRIAFASNYFNKLPADAPEWNVLETYKTMGANLQPVVFPDSAIYPFEIMEIVLGSETSAAFDELTRTNRDDLIERQDKDFWPTIFRAGRMIPATEYINANRLRYALCMDINDFMKNYDVVIIPSFGKHMATTNLTGHPAICMPIGFNKNGTPISITLMGNLFDEANIIAAAKAYQDKTDHHQKHPEKFKR